ncbi:hypothetical protein [Priestia aryabhattai]
MDNATRALEKIDNLFQDQMFINLIKIAVLLEELQEEAEKRTEVASQKYLEQDISDTKTYVSGYRDGLLFMKGSIDKKFSIMNDTIRNILGIPEEIWDTMYENMNSLIDELEKNDVSEEVMEGAIRCSLAKHLKPLNAL